TLVPTTYLVDTTLSNSSDSDQTVQDVRLRMTAVNNLFYRFNFKIFGITLTAHGHLSLSHLK
ncbi:hypothetical protein, partial [Escherichia coli]|uniref:hypothetical protein n=1 Tax=Escherichia coli TaxID=562 RepID=UPI0019D3F51C